MKTMQDELSNDQVRTIILQYFYDRNQNATSRRGKKGSAVKMKDIKSEIKTQCQLKDPQIISNLTYLISQGWVAEEKEERTFTRTSGASFPASTIFYTITAQGIDKIEGTSAFTPNRFEGIKIEATGQNIITLGNGNQINVKYKEASQALTDLREAVKKNNELNELQKFEIVNDIDTIQSQLAKANPNRNVIASIWEGINRLSSIVTLAQFVAAAAPYVLPLIDTVAVP